MEKERIRLSREFLDWEWLNRPEIVSLYVYLLLRASSKQAVVYGVSIERGQVLSLRNAMQRDLGISAPKLTTALRMLQESNLISIQKVRQYSLVTLLKYDEYAV